MALWDPEIDVVISDSEDEDYDFYEKDFSKGREALLFVVDANLYKDKDRFQEALRVISGAFCTSVVINDKDLLGVVFANTEHTPEPYEPNCMDNIEQPDNCAVLLPLRQLTKGIVEYYLNFMTLASKTFDTKYGVSANGGSFITMIHLCINLFDNASYPVNNARLVYMTDRDTPHAPQSHKYQMALQKARDLEGRSIEFNVVPMINDFNYEPFYKEFVSLARGAELDTFLPPDAEQLRENFALCKVKSNSLGRTLGHFNLSLGANLEIAAQYYRYFKNKYYPRKIKLLREDNTIIQKKRVVVAGTKDPETLEITDRREVKSTEAWHEIRLGQMSIRISPEQINRVRNLHVPGMMLLGFKPKSSLDDYVYYKPCNFMYPDDRCISGSKRLFRALWERCMEREKIAVCVFMRKKKSIPRYVALVPVTAEKPTNDKHAIYLPVFGDGFKIIYLPMGKHIRHNDLSDWNSIENSASEEGTQLLKEVVKKLLIKYRSNDMYDPVLKQLQDDVLALGLNISADDPYPTSLEIATKHDERIKEIIPKINEVFGADIEVVPKRKRANEATASVGESIAKRVKVTDEDLQSLDYVKGLMEAKTLENCTMQQLRLILETHYGVKAAKSAKKQKYIEEIYELSKNVIEIN